MPIRNITTDYTGRAKDINISPTIDPTKTSVQKVTPGFGNVSSYCAGVQKLLQRFMIALTTVRGSQPAYPTFGTDLLKTIAVSSLTTVADLKHAFNFASAKVVSEFREYQAATPGLPDDEQLDTALLLDISVTANYEVTYRVALYTKAGETYDFLLPIPISK